MSKTSEGNLAAWLTSKIRDHRRHHNDAVCSSTCDKNDAELADEIVQTIVSEIERLQTEIRKTVESLQDNARVCRDAIPLASSGVGLLTEAQTCEGVASHLEKVLGNVE